MVKTKSMKKHEQGLQDIINRLYNDNIKWNKIGKHLEYGHYNRLTGEIDVYAIHCNKGTKMYIFEYKINDKERNIEKGIEQLDRVKKHYEKKGYHIKAFLVYKSNGVNKYKWIR